MAMNPIIQALSGKSLMPSKLGQMKNMINMMKAGGNPQAMVNQMMQSNPQINQIIQQYGGDPQTAFYKFAEANGIDPNEVLNMLK